MITNGLYHRYTTLQLPSIWDSIKWLNVTNNRSVKLGTSAANAGCLQFFINHSYPAQIRTHRHMKGPLLEIMLWINSLTYIHTVCTHLHRRHNYEPQEGLVVSQAGLTSLILGTLASVLKAYLFSSLCQGAHTSSNVNRSHQQIMQSGQNEPTHLLHIVSRQGTSLKEQRDICAVGILHSTEDTQWKYLSVRLLSG